VGGVAAVGVDLLGLLWYCSLHLSLFFGRVRSERIRPFLFCSALLLL